VMLCHRLAPISAGARVMIKTLRHDKPGITTHPAARRRHPMAAPPMWKCGTLWGSRVGNELFGTGCYRPYSLMIGRQHFHEDDSAALADDRRRAVTSTHVADDGGRLQTVAVAPTHPANDTFGEGIGRTAQHRLHRSARRVNGQPDRRIFTVIEADGEAMDLGPDLPVLPVTAARSSARMLLYGRLASSRGSRARR